MNGSVNPPGSPTLRLDRQIIGVEATFGDRFGAGLRLPFLQLGGTSDADTRDVGDLTAVFKYAVVNDPCIGNAVTLGLNITFPTGGRGGNLGQSDDGRPLPRAVFVQPWVGAIWNAGDLFFQGTSAVLLPTDPVYPAALFNSFGTGYWLYRDGSMAFLRGIAPVIEVHANTPITNRGSDNPLVFRDQVNITSGLFIQFTRLSIGGAVSVPLVGPRPFDVEGIFTASYQF